LLDENFSEVLIDFLAQWFKLHWREPNPVLQIGEPHWRYSTISQFCTFCFIAEWSLLHKTLKVLLKDC